MAVMSRRIHPGLVRSRAASPRLGHPPDPRSLRRLPVAADRHDDDRAARVADETGCDPAIERATDPRAHHEQRRATGARQRHQAARRRAVDDRRQRVAREHAASVRAARASSAPRSGSHAARTSPRSIRRARPAAARARCVARSRGPVIPQTTGPGAATAVPPRRDDHGALPVRQHDSGTCSRSGGGEPAPRPAPDHDECGAELVGAPAHLDCRRTCLQLEHLVPEVEPRGKARAHAEPVLDRRRATARRGRSAA